MLLVLRPHVRRLAGPALVLLALAPAVGLTIGFLPGGSPAPVRLVVVLAGAAVLLRWVVRPFLTWWNTVYAVSTMRIMAYRGVVRRSGHEVPLSAVVDVSVEQGVVDRVTGSGTLVVSSAGGVELALPDVPQVVAVQRALHRLTDDPDRDPWRGADEIQDGHDGYDGTGGYDDTGGHGRSAGDDEDGRHDGDGWERAEPPARERYWADDLLDEQRALADDADLPLPQPPRGRGPKAWFGRRR